MEFQCCQFLVVDQQPHKMKQYCPARKSQTENPGDIKLQSALWRRSVVVVKVAKACFHITFNETLSKGITGVENTPVNTVGRKE